MLKDHPFALPTCVTGRSHSCNLDFYILNCHICVSTCFVTVKESGLTTFHSADGAEKIICSCSS